MSEQNNENTLKSMTSCEEAYGVFNQEGNVITTGSGDAIVTDVSFFTISNGEKTSLIDVQNLDGDNPCSNILIQNGFTTAEVGDAAPHQLGSQRDVGGVYWGYNNQFGSESSFHESLRIGDDNVFGDNVTIEEDVVIGHDNIFADNVTIMSDSCLGDNLTVGNNATLMSGAYLPSGTIVKDYEVVEPSTIDIACAFSKPSKLHVPEVVDFNDAKSYESGREGTTAEIIVPEAPLSSITEETPFYADPAVGMALGVAFVTVAGAHFIGENLLSGHWLRGYEANAEADDAPVADKGTAVSLEKKTPEPKPADGMTKEFLLVCQSCAGTTSGHVPVSQQVVECSYCARATAYTKPGVS